VFHTFVSSFSFVFFYVASVCFKSRSGIAHEMHVENDRRRGTSTSTLPREPDALALVRSICKSVKEPNAVIIGGEMDDFLSV
jgi:hypothetical protein